jgi:hypothetical protein
MESPYWFEVDSYSTPPPHPGFLGAGNDYGYYVQEHPSVFVSSELLREGAAMPSAALEVLSAPPANASGTDTAIKNAIAVATSALNSTMEWDVSAALNAHVYCVQPHHMSQNTSTASATDVQSRPGRGESAQSPG